MDAAVEAASISATAGVVGGMASAWFVHWLNRDQYAATLKKTKEEGERAALELENLRGNVQAMVSYQTASEDVTTLYDSAGGFGGFDFVTDPWGGGEGRIKLLDGDVKDGILGLERTNTGGGVRLVLKSYRVGGVQTTMLSPAAAGARRRLRANVEARTLGAEHTMLLVIKDPKAGAGVHLAEWRERLVDDAWKQIEAYFEFTSDVEVLFRIDDRSVSKAPSSLQIRRLRLTEKKD